MNCLPLTMHSLPPSLLVFVGVIAGFSLALAFVGFLDWRANRGWRS